MRGESPVLPLEWYYRFRPMKGKSSNLLLGCGEVNSRGGRGSEVFFFFFLDELTTAVVTEQKKRSRRAPRFRQFRALTLSASNIKRESHQFQR